MMVGHFSAIMIGITFTMMLMIAFLVVSNGSENMVAQDSFSAYRASKMPELDYYRDYDILRAEGNVAVIYPIFTQGAYDWGGIHDYYAGYCESCKSAKIPDSYEKTFSASGNGFRILEFLGYQVIDDIDVDKNPKILQQYDKIILLHNEFVTKTEFDAITSHPNVVYLYPNALSSQIIVDYEKNEITLIRGPGYPDDTISSGFDWTYDNTQFMKDWDCKFWEFYKVENGHMLNCYPETYLPDDGRDLLYALKNL